MNVVFLFHIVKPFAPVTVFHVFQLYFEDTVGKVFFGMLGHCLLYTSIAERIEHRALVVHIRTSVADVVVHYVG